MKRYRAWISVLSVIAIPTVAAACWPMWGRPAYRPMAFPAPMYAPLCQPAPIYVSPPIYQPPAPTFVYPPPRIEPAPRTASPSAAPAPAPEMGTATPSSIPPVAVPMHPKNEDPVRPAGGSDTPPLEYCARLSSPHGKGLP